MRGAHGNNIKRPKKLEPLTAGKWDVWYCQVNDHGAGWAEPNGMVAPFSKHTSILSMH
jgi:hypothetical protein